MNESEIVNMDISLEMCGKFYDAAEEHLNIAESWFNFAQHCLDNDCTHDADLAYKMGKQEKETAHQYHKMGRSFKDHYESIIEKIKNQG